VPTASATQPEEFTFLFAFAAPGQDWGYCGWSTDFPLFTGCVVQDNTPGRAAHGIFYSFEWEFVPDGDDGLLYDLPTLAEVTGAGDPFLRGECEYNLATFDIPGRPEAVGTPVFASKGCTGPELEGLFLQGKAGLGATGFIIKYHWHPKFDPDLQ
jgi:hypothetical protein